MRCSAGDAAHNASKRFTPLCIYFIEYANAKLSGHIIADESITMDTDREKEIGDHITCT